MKLSIITPTYNRCENLKQTLASIKMQSFNCFEHIIIDNMSDDGTLELVEEYKAKADYKVSYIREPDSGIYNAINKGIRITKGEWVHILNSDDRYASADSLRNIFSLDSIDKYDLLASTILLGNPEGSQNSKKWIPKYNEKWHHYNFPHPGIILKKSFYENKGYYSEKYKIVSDAIFGTKHYDCAKYLIIDKPLVVMSEGGMSNVANYRHIFEKTLVLFFYHKFPFIIKIKYTFFYFIQLLHLMKMDILMRLK